MKTTCEGFCDGCNEAIEAENVEHAGEVVAERHQAPFAAYLVEAADEEVLIAGAAFERPEGMLDREVAGSVPNLRISSAQSALRKKLAGNWPITHLESRGEFIRAFELTRKHLQIGRA